MTHAYSTTKTYTWDELDPEQQQWIEWKNEFAAREEEQERQAYMAEMAEEQAERAESELDKWFPRDEQAEPEHTHEQKFDAKQFALAGNATFTVVNEETGNRFTFKVQASDDGKRHYVKVLTGPDNWTNYTYLGTIFDGKNYKHGKQSSISEKAQSAKVFAWFWSHLDNLPENVKVHHEGKCGRCGRKLTVPESIVSGFGPECVKHVK